MQKKGQLFLVIFLLLLSGFWFGEAKAGAGDNVSGFAWSENIGWISFNNISGGGATDYGVNIDASGVFSGYAWSENIGWISFKESELTGCPGGTCQAKLNFSTGQVSGWAKVLSNNSWIRLRDANYGVNWNPANGEMSGWAWSDTDIGWISFHCENSGVCGTSNYKVTALVDNTPPTVTVIANPASVTATWQNTDAAALVSCDDGVGGSGCATTTYKLKTHSSAGTCSTAYSDYTLSSPQTISSHLFVCAAAKDTVGNAGFSPTRVEFKVDKTQPNSQIQSPSSGTWFSNDFPIDTLDEDLESDLDTTQCQYKVIPYEDTNGDGTGDAERASSGWLSRTCNTSAQNISVGTSAGDYCKYQAMKSCYVYIRSKDIAGNWHSPTEEADSIRYYHIDWTNPQPGRLYITPAEGEQVYPITVDEGEEYNYKVHVTDNIKVAACDLYINGINKGVMSPVVPGCTTDCTFTKNYAFPDGSVPDGAGSRTYDNNYARCKDAAQNVVSGLLSSILVRENNPPAITAGPSYTTSPCTSPTTQPGCQVNFTVSATDADGDPLTYSWIFGNGGTSDLQNPSYHYNATGTYAVVVTVSDGRGGVVSAGLNITVTASEIINQPPVCQVSVPEIAKAGQWIDIGVGGSFDPEGGMSSVSFCSDKNPANPNGRCDESWTKDYLWNTPENPPWANAVSKTMKWIFTQTGDYEVWAEVKDNVNQTASCFDTIVVTECLSGDTKTCTSPQGCSHTLNCQANGTWPSCPGDACSPGATQDCGLGGTRTCTNTCSWGSCTEPGICLPPAPSCPTCQHAVCVDEAWSCQADIAGTDCGDCRECSGTGSCTYLCSGICVADSCTTCPSYYNGGCGYGYCGALEVPSWSYSGGACQYQCLYSAACEPAGEEEEEEEEEEPPCQRRYPEVYLLPSPQSGTAGDLLTYTVSVKNKDSSACGASTFSLTRSCPSGWSCSLTSSSLSVLPGQSQSTVLGITSPSPPYPRGDYDVSVTATNSGFPVYSSRGYGVYQISNNPPTAAITCYPQGCSQAVGSCTGYTWSSFCLMNDSSDPDGSADIKNSIWTITGPMGDTSNCLAVSGIPLCDWTLPSHFSSGNYTAELSVEDERGATDTALKPFVVLQDIIADFDCSLALEGPWQECRSIRVSEGEIVHFRDQSTPSQGASLSSWSWQFEDGTPSASTLQHPSASFTVVDAGSGGVRLTVTDSAGRSDTAFSQVRVTVPLPEWRETPPF